MHDTFVRSCEHWSESRRAGMEDFYSLATVDYRHLAESRDWRVWLEEHQQRVGERSLRLLDVACGSGKFPAALLRHGTVGDAHIRPIKYDLLDPSAFSLREARAVLAPPFVAANDFETTLQDFEGEGYDLAWATHALYAVPAAELDAALERMLAAITPGGEAFIAHAAECAHYMRFYRLFLDAFRGGQGTPFSSAEHIEEVLRGLGARVSSTVLRYDNVAPDLERVRVEGFLQRCAFDDAVSLEQMLAEPALGAYLRSCLSEGAWRFSQAVHLISITR